MRLLLDTHYLIWALDRPALLPAVSRAAIEDPANEILFSAASIWEVAIKASLGRGDWSLDAPEKLARAASMTGFQLLPITDAHAADVAGLPMLHRDPFDRLLVAQAKALPARLLTADRLLVPYSELVWHVPARTGVTAS